MKKKNTCQSILNIDVFLFLSCSFCFAEDDNNADDAACFHKKIFYS